MRITRLLCGSSLATLALAFLAAISLTESASAQPRRLARPPATRPAPATPSALAGSIDSFNLDVDGVPNAILLKDSTGKIIQINFPHDMASLITTAVAPGDQVNLTAVGKLSMPEHPVYELRTLKGPKGQQIKVPQPHTDGTIKRLNYSTEGNVDGAILDGGEFIHIDPKQAGQLNLAVGQKISVDGIVRPMVSSTPVIVATSVNGTTIRPDAFSRRGLETEGVDRSAFGGANADRDGRPGSRMNRGGRGPMGGAMLEGSGFAGPRMNSVGHGPMRGGRDDGPDAAWGPRMNRGGPGPMRGGPGNGPDRSAGQRSDRDGSGPARDRPDDQRNGPDDPVGPDAVRNHDGPARPPRLVVIAAPPTATDQRDIDRRCQMVMTVRGQVTVKLQMPKKGSVAQRSPGIPADIVLGNMLKIAYHISASATILWYFWRLAATGQLSLY